MPTLTRTLSTLLLLINLSSLVANEVVNEVTQLHPIVVDKVITPKSLDEIVAAVKSTEGPISIGGARHSQGGQIAEENSLHLDMRDFNHVVAFDPKQKTITVESGITWREIQQTIDPYNLSVSIMQSYANFTVGGSLSVNCHGRYIGAGPIIHSVKSLKVVLADGSIVEASPELDPDIFYAVIGGYGGIGVIAEATLQLTDNTKVERQDKVMPISSYKDYFFSNIRNSTNAVFHNADIYPPAFDTVRAVTWSVTDKPVTNPERLIGTNESYWLNPMLIAFDSEMPFGKQIREYVVEPLQYLSHPVVWRNHEASYDAAELEPSSRKTSTYVLQEYFVPVDRFDEFYPKIAEILKRHNVNVINISIRHADQYPGSLLAWAKTEVFAFVLYYKQGTTESEKQTVAVWTRELISAALSVNGSYYLPYQIHATSEQFQAAYPRFQEYFSIKSRLDSKDKFRNKLWDAYYPAAIAAGKKTPEPSSKF